MRIGSAQAKRADIVFKINACSADVKLEDTSKKTAANWTISAQKQDKLGGMSISEHAVETQKRLINVQKMRGPAQPWGKRQKQKRKQEETSGDDTQGAKKKSKKGKDGKKAKKGKDGKKGKGKQGRQPKNDEGAPATQTQEPAAEETH